MKFRLIIVLLLALIGFPLSAYANEDHDHGHDHKEDVHEAPEKEGHGHDHEEDAHEGEGHEEGHEESPSGASFKPGKGVFVTDETQGILGLETANAVEETLPQQIRCNIQVYGDPHRFHGIDPEKTGCDIHGSGFLTEEQAGLVRPNQKVTIKADGRSLEGFVVAVQRATATGETEVIIGVLNAESELRDGQFVETAIVLPSDKPVITIPSEAVLKTLEGTFIYRADGDYFQRTPIKVGDAASGRTEVVEGVSVGDKVVVKPVQTLWLIELRATKGGGHSH